MDDAARLVSELHHKLAELDGKVAAYQRDMLTEFHKHMDECLEKYPDHVSKQVSRAIAESMSTGRYPALSPPASAAPDLPATTHNAGGRKSPPPVLRHTSGTPKEEPRSPHAREKEFQGLFTPTYLPLLESRGPAERSPPMPPPTTSDGPLPALSAENVKKAEEPKQALPPRPEGRPVTARRLTDQSTSSTSSSGSDSKARRSALRRSSSANKSSPRRVRFEFEGEEVFPASSVSQVPTVMLDVESGAEPEPETKTPAVATKDESTAYSGTSLLDVEGDEDLLPRPRKVSSTQALQALTRSPLEEGSVWRVVDSKNEALDKMNGANQPETRDLPTRVDSQATIQANDADEEPGDGQLGTPIEEQANYDEYDNASDEDVLSMRPKGKSPSPATPKTPFARPPLRPAPVSTTTPERNGHPDTDEDDDPFFDLDDEGVHPTARSTQPPQKYLPDPPSDDDEETTSGRLRKAARDEARQAQSSSKVPPVSPSAVLFGHSIGSYMGRSMTINPIKDPKLYDEIAGMKDVQFFVGSIDDCTKAEAAAMGSYRAGASSLARNARVDVAPRSFSERLALEEEMERRAEAGEGGF
jgi:hypothetical protein